MQAIILAAGMGKRLGELTQNNTKCMVKVNGVTLIDRLMTQLSELSLKKIIIVIGYQGEKLRSYLGENYLNTKIEYIYNPIYDKTNNIYSLALAKESLQEDDSLLIESDLIFDDSFSALDYKTDAKLREELNTKEKDTTKIIVAQRISTIRHADKIIVLDNGKMVGYDTHDNLMKNCSVYQEIAYSQLSKEELN